MRVLGCLVLVLATAVAVGCSRPPSLGDQRPEPATVEKIDGSDVGRIVLTERAAARLGIEVAPVVQRKVGGVDRLAVPYSAVLYDPDGATWTYTSPAPLTYIRERVTVESIVDDVALLADGPAPGTTVVVVGVTELFGTEFEVGH